MRKRGIPTTKDLLYKILEMLTDHVKNDKSNVKNAQQNKVLERNFVRLSVRAE